MDKRKLLISIASFSFVALLVLGLLLVAEPQKEAVGEVSAGSEITALESLSMAFTKVAETVTPSVVNISTTSVVKNSRSSRQRSPFWDRDPLREFFGDDFFKFFEEPQKPSKRRSLGSGVIMSKDGYIVTNNHVVGNADEIKVTLSDNREFDAKLVGTDRDTDVAVIKIEAKDLPVAVPGNSGKLKVGEWVLAIGNPFGLEHSVTHGIVSAVGRSGMNITIYEDFIQTDASINPGNSGGPLVNIKGKVIGINTAIATAGGVPGNVGVGFAIPIDMAEDVMQQLIDKGQVTRGWLGISFQPVDRDIADKYGLKEPVGALIVLIDDPAKKAGLKPGDLIMEFEGQKIQDGAHLKKIVAAVKPGQTVKMKIIRDGKEKEFKVTLSERTDEAVARLSGVEAPAIPSEAEEWMGLTVQELSEELAQRLGYEAQKGVIITDVAPEGPAAEAKDPPKPGDLIQEIEGQEIRDMANYRDATKKVKDQKSVLVRLQRASERGRAWYVVLKKQEQKDG